MTAGGQVHVLIVTALQLERVAVRADLRDLEVVEAGGIYADIGVFDAAPRPTRVAVIETGAGNVAAAVLTARAEDELRPERIFMVGVAGGLKDVAVGDVVASSKVYWLEGAKHEQTVKPRPEVAPISNSLVQLARAVAADGTWIARRRGGDAEWEQRPPQSLVAPLVAGEKVLADRGSDSVALIRAAYSDAVAVDMEDFGTLRGGEATERAKTIAVRGISDLVEGKAGRGRGRVAAGRCRERRRVHVRNARRRRGDSTWSRSRDSRSAGSRRGRRGALPAGAATGRALAARRRRRVAPVDRRYRVQPMVGRRDPPPARRRWRRHHLGLAARQHAGGLSGEPRCTRTRRRGAVTAVGAPAAPSLNGGRTDALRG